MAFLCGCHLLGSMLRTLKLVVLQPRSRSAALQSAMVLVLEMIHIYNSSSQAKLQY